MYKYSLRLQISPNLNYEERIKNALDFCEKAKIDDVMFFCAAEDLFVGHVTKEQAQKYVDVILLAKSELEKKGISVSLNPWITIGHYDGGRKLQDGQNFSTMVGHDGIVAEVCACPLSESWREYYVDLLNFYVDKLNPDTLWLEDDFRFGNKQTKDGFINYACFCDKHMALYRKSLGEDVTREELVERISTDEKARKAYIDVNRAVLEDTLKYLSARVKNLNRFGLMTGGASLEQGRRFKEFFKILNEGRKKPYNRQAFCCYRQLSGQHYMSNVNRVSFLVRTLTGDSAECVSEIENFPHGNYVKSVKFSKFQMLSALPLLLCGATFSIFDFTGNGAIEYDRLAKMYGEIKPYLSKIADMNLLQTNSVGVKILVDEDVAYKAKTTQYFGGYSDDTGYLFSYLEMLGVACSYTQNLDIEGETVGVSGQVLRSIGKERAEKLLKNNFVILMGDGVEALFELGLNNLICAKSYERLEERNNPHTMEEINSNEKVCGITKIRATNHYASGDFISIKYAGERNVYTNMLNCHEEKIGDSITLVNKTLIIPFTTWYEMPIPYSLFAKLREHVIKKVIKENAPSSYYVVNQPNVSPYVFEKDGNAFIMCVNFCDDDYEYIDIKTNKKYSDFKIYTTDNPNGYKPSVVEEDDGYKLKECLKGMETFVIICK